MLTLIGLGAQKNDLSLGALNALREADEVLVRTRELEQIRTLEELSVSYTTLDFLYESSRNYTTFTRKCAAEVLRRAKEKSVCYCVDGSVTEDASALLLRKKGVRVFDGTSKASRLALLAGIGGNYCSVSAFEIQDRPLFLPLVTYDLTKDNVSTVKLVLCERFGDEIPVFLIDGKARKISLYEADRTPFGAFAGIAVPEIPLLQKKRFCFDDAVAILKRLRAPDGCPWDRVQTHESIRINALEEAYELTDAIDLKAPDKICEEAGDVLMQALFHTLIEEENGNFTVTDMLSELCEKLITRHTHVFGQDKASGAEGALSVWEKNKMREKGQKTFSDAVKDVPACFPALLRAQKIAKRVEKGGWDRATFENFEVKFREEYEELLAAFRSGDRKRTEEELGDVLLCTAELGRAVGEDCEIALLDAAKRLQNRYLCYESLVRADGKDVCSLSDEEKQDYYRRAKDACSRT